MAKKKAVEKVVVEKKKGRNTRRQKPRKSALKKFVNSAVNDVKSWLADVLPDDLDLQVQIPHAMIEGVDIGGGGLSFKTHLKGAAAGGKHLAIQSIEPAARLSLNRDGGSVPVAQGAQLMGFNEVSPVQGARAGDPNAPSVDAIRARVLVAKLPTSAVSGQIVMDFDLDAKSGPLAITRLNEMMELFQRVCWASCAIYYVPAAAAIQAGRVGFASFADPDDSLGESAGGDERVRRLVELGTGASSSQLWNALCFFPKINQSTIWQDVDTDPVGAAGRRQIAAGRIQCVCLDDWTSTTGSPGEVWLEVFIITSGDMPAAIGGSAPVTHARCECEGHAEDIVTVPHMNNVGAVVSTMVGTGFPPARVNASFVEDVLNVRQSGPPADWTAVGGVMVTNKWSATNNLLAIGWAAEDMGSTSNLVFKVRPGSYVVRLQTANKNVAPGVPTLTVVSGSGSVTLGVSNSTPYNGVANGETKAEFVVVSNYSNPLVVQVASPTPPLVTHQINCSIVVTILGTPSWSLTSLESRFSPRALEEMGYELGLAESGYEGESGHIQRVRWYSPAEVAEREKMGESALVAVQSAPYRVPAQAVVGDKRRIPLPRHR